MSDYLTKADVWHFAALFSEPLGLHVSKWVRELLSVEIISPGEGSGRKGKLVYVPREGGKYQDSGEIETTWFPEGQDCFEQAQRLVGQRALFFQHNERVGDPDANDGRGYRCVRWVEPADSGWAPSVSHTSSRAGSDAQTAHNSPYLDEQVEREQRVAEAQQEARSAVNDPVDPHDLPASRTGAVEYIAAMPAGAALTVAELAGKGDVNELIVAVLKADEGRLRKLWTWIDQAEEEARRPF